jgi:hypothetical protein
MFNIKLFVAPAKGDYPRFSLPLNRFPVLTMQSNLSGRPAIEWLFFKLHFPVYPFENIDPAIPVFGVLKD